MNPYYPAPEVWTISDETRKKRHAAQLKSMCSYARRLSQKAAALRPGLIVYVIDNPDYPEQGEPYTIATDRDMDTYYTGTPDSAILAAYSAGEKIG